MLRHLEYAFSVSVEGLQSYKFDASNGGVATVNSQGSVAAPEGGSGTMYVDVVSLAPDGALVVRIAELVQGDPRPRQAYTCTVYGSTSVLCPSMPGPSETEWVLLSYLGRQFVDGAPWDSQGHWQRKEQSTQFEMQENFTLIDAGDGKRVIAREVKKTRLNNGGFDSQTSEVTINYDRSMEVPDVVRDEVATTGGRRSEPCELPVYAPARLVCQAQALTPTARRGSARLRASFCSRGTGRAVLERSCTSDRIFGRYLAGFQNARGGRILWQRSSYAS
jgi:hypothetical protein